MTGESLAALAWRVLHVARHRAELDRRSAAEVNTLNMTAHARRWYAERQAEAEAEIAGIDELRARLRAELPECEQ